MVTARELPFALSGREAPFACEWQPVPVVKREHDPDLDIFDRGVWMVRQGDRHVGHVLSTLGHFRSILRPRTRQDWIWALVIWSDGSRERPMEDYPPWTFVRELLDGFLTWDTGIRAGTYEVDLLPAEDREAVWASLGVSASLF